MITAVLFDFAGTLFAPCDAVSCVETAARATGMTLMADEVADLARAYVEAGFPGGPYPATVPEELAASYTRRDLSSGDHRRAYVGLLSTVDGPAPDFAHALYDQVREPSGWVPYPDALGVVTALEDRGIRLGIISNIGFDIRPILHAHGFATLAETCTLSFEHGCTKPDPRLFAVALRGLHVEPSEALMVGDHPDTDDGALACGMRTWITPMRPAGAHRGLDHVLTLIP